MPARGLSLHIGINRNDASHYPNIEPLHAAEADADAMAEIATQLGYETPRVLHSEQATLQTVRGAIHEAAKALKTGDIFLLTYAGHGGQVPDRNHDEDDQADETWCLYDSQLIDDELHEDLARFASGVRISIVSDSCHSGTVAREAFLATLTPALATPDAPRARMLPRELAARVYQRNRADYDKRQAATRANAAETMAASAILLAGCQDSQVAYDGTFNGAFTSRLLATWNGGRYAEGKQASYRRFHRKIVDAMGPLQVPNYLRLGASNQAFERQAPFVIQPRE
jgi:hypothetical protein